jgi:hypothetical protein
MGIREILVRIKLRIRTSDKWIRIQLRIRLLSSVTLRMPKFVVKILFCKHYLSEKGRTRIHTSDQWIRVRVAQNEADPDPQHW